ncbi:MaoC family dehydratase [Halomonas dongshanensis]|uniref:MaoC family dehydratase n=1 Tax=Halomonas dongshanensis TaxID=2890835 RepID=A0ABT2EAW7_9GAMM|nr:MaoC family dehydratase [Halomonas dongshanensis]MCS2608732.1 MaoC family dehydratase [Halomonas dongshanensis]
MTTTTYEFDDIDLATLIDNTFTNRRTVSEFDVLGFAGITGDLAANHTDELYMQESGFSGRIAHGVLLLGYTSTLSTKVADLIREPVVSLGYDRVRFIKPVYIGTTIECRYTLKSIDRGARRLISKTSVYEANSEETILVATHIMKVL